jgi:hypothetical protein
MPFIGQTALSKEDKAMSMDLARKDFSTAPEYFIAGVDIGIAKTTKTASEAVEAHTPVLIADGKVKPIAAPSSAGAAVLTGLYGVTADSAEADKDVPVYLSGEFFADALVLPDNVSVADVEVPLRNLGIFLV